MREAIVTTEPTDGAISWITSPAALAASITDIGRKHSLDEALVRRAVPALEPFFRARPQLWRLNFEQPTWNNRRRGDGRLGGDWFDGGWGPLSPYID
jgi:hypothetical protein